MAPGACARNLEVVVDAADEWRRERLEAGLPLESTEVVWFTGPDSEYVVSAIGREGR
jgi:hypothetical protein